ncbi:MAG TPA: hypothetical protein VK498_09395 [Ferruginibacter sp.]|nr:hypothetical protein [Ferruginibacter sp.]
MSLFKILPSIEEVILKVKQLSDLTRDEHFVYLLHIEELSEPEANKIIEEIYEKSEYVY